MEARADENTIDKREYDDSDEEAHNSQTNNDEAEDEADEIVAPNGLHQDGNTEAHNSETINDGAEDKADEIVAPNGMHQEGRKMHGKHTRAKPMYNNLAHATAECECRGYKL